jgi:hypothetical protein
MLDYFQPIPIIGTITTSGWGIGTSGPRDTGNGIEDIANWRYWDGKILKADDGKYHLFCSKWAASKGIAAWMSDSVSVHAVSDNVLGPYKEIGLTYSYQNGRGHNTTGLKLIDGTYAVVESAIVPGWIFTSSSLDGPFNYKGSIATDNNGINASNLTSAPSPNKRHFRDARAPTTPASPCDKRRYRTLRLLRPPHAQAFRIDRGRWCRRLDFVSTVCPGRQDAVAGSLSGRYPVLHRRPSLGRKRACRVPGY